SDVCSSDLRGGPPGGDRGRVPRDAQRTGRERRTTALRRGGPRLPRRACRRGRAALLGRERQRGIQPLERLLEDVVTGSEVEPDEALAALAVVSALAEAYLGQLGQAGGRHFA